MLLLEKRLNEEERELIEKILSVTSEINTRNEALRWTEGNIHYTLKGLLDKLYRLENKLIFEKAPLISDEGQMSFDFEDKGE